MKRLIVLLTVLIAYEGYSNDIPSYASIPIHLASGQSLPLSERISLKLKTHSSNELASALAQWPNIEITEHNESSLTLTLASKTKSHGQAVQSHLKSSFIIDLEETSTQQFLNGFSRYRKSSETLKDIRRYVHQYINKPTSIHGFNVASVIAQNQEGDCTEYAVLTTALARSLKIPSRIVIGSVILAGNDKLSSFGHAWSETWSNGEWHVLDSALYGLSDFKIFYLPASSLNNEGPGYQFSLISAAKLLPSEIKEVASKDDASQNY